jgi:hypothetical protein
MKKTLTNSIAVLAIGAAMMAPTLSSAQNWHRQSQKDTWKNLAIGSGAVGLLGILTHNDTLTAIGAAGALYSAYRYDADGRCYGERTVRGHSEWVRVADRDRRDQDRNWNRDRNSRDNSNGNRDHGRRR